jgi:hypothetical protein
VSKLTQVMAAVRRFAVWLLPAGRRDWLAALWAEAYEVPPGLTRLAWRAGGVWVLARGALMPRRLVRVVLFAAAGAGAAWVAWPQSGVGHVAEGRFNAIAPVLVLAVPVIGLITSYLAAVIANPAPLDARSPSPGLPMTSGG